MQTLDQVIAALKKPNVPVREETNLTGTLKDLLTQSSPKDAVAALTKGKSDKAWLTAITMVSSPLSAEVIEQVCREKKSVAYYIAAQASRKLSSTTLAELKTLSGGT